MSKQFEIETGGYSDIDLIYAKRQNQMRPTKEIDDDELEMWLMSKREKEETKEIVQPQL